MRKILMVCLGNICRSPLAEGIMLKLISEHQLDIQVDSAGTSGYHIDEAPDKRTILNASEHKIDLTDLRARQFTIHDFDRFDEIYVMDKSNLKNVLALTNNEHHLSKVDLLLNASHPNQNKEVPDPYFGDEKGFEHVFNLIHHACLKIALD